MKHITRLSAGALLLSLIAAPALAVSPPAKQLARETLDLLPGQERMLATAVRQRDSRGGKEDFQRFVIQPVRKMQDRWLAQPKEVRFEFLACTMALQEFENFAGDSFKAGTVGKPTSAYRDGVAQCKKDAR